MPKLHLVAITPDHKGLVLSEQAGSKRGDLVLDIDDRLLDAIEKAQRLRARDEAGQLESFALPSKRQVSAADGERPSPREIQQRLRAGETVAGIAKAAGLDEEWVERFAAPVMAELQTVVDKAKVATFAKRGVGPSTLPLAPSVASNILERGTDMSLGEIDGAWSAHVRPDGGWSVTFTYIARGRRQRAEWGYEPDTGEVSSRNKLATELGYRDSDQRGAKPAAKPKAAAPKPTPDELVEEAFDDGTQTLPGTDIGPELSDADLPTYTRRPPAARKAPPRKAATGKPETGRDPGSFGGPPPGFEPEVADADLDGYGEPEVAGTDFDDDSDDDGIPVLAPEEFLAGGFLADEPEPEPGPEPPFPTFPDTEVRGEPPLDEAPPRA